MSSQLESAPAGTKPRLKAYLYFAEPDAFRTNSMLQDTSIAAVACAYSVWAMTGSGKDVIAKGFVLLLAGIPIYVAMKRWRSRTAPAPGSELALPASGNGRPAAKALESAVAR